MADQDFTDWRGNTIKVGDLVLYPRMSSRSVEIREARVTDIYQVYRDEDWNWTRHNPGDPVPKRRRRVWDPETFRYVTQEVYEEGLEWRIQLQPTGQSSRGFLDGYHSMTGKEVKPIIITVVKNVTKIGDGSLYFGPPRGE